MKQPMSAEELREKIAKQFYLQMADFWESGDNWDRLSDGQKAEHFEEAGQILKDFNQWLEENRALHETIHPEIDEFNTFIEPLRLEIK